MLIDIASVADIIMIIFKNINAQTWFTNIDMI